MMENEKKLLFEMIYEAIHEFGLSIMQGRDGTDLNNLERYIYVKLPIQSYKIRIELSSKKVSSG